MQGMIEMAADKETFLVPAPPPPLLKPPPRGGGGGAGGGDVPLVQLPQGAAPAELHQEDAQGQPAAAATEAAGHRDDTASPLGPSARLNQGAHDARPAALPPHPPVQRRPPAKGGGPSAAAAAAAAEEGEDSVSELQRPRNGFQPPPPPPHHQPRAPCGGKRRSSCNAGGGFKHPAFKRRRRVNSESDPVLPSEFLLGGNIFDPLNLNSLLDEEVNQAVNAETPKSSPLPAKGRDPVEILIPKDITDPLSLNNAQEDPPVLASPVKPGRKRHRHRGAQRGTAGVEGGGAGGKPPLPTSCKACQKTCNGATPQPYELNTAINCRDEVVSPLLPAAGEAQPGQQASGCATPSGTSVASWTAGGGSSGGSSSRHHRKRRRTSSKSEGSGGGGGGGGRHPGASTSGEQPCRSSPDRGHSVPRGRHPQAAPGQVSRRQPHHKFQYGNYCKYYGYRNPNCEDSRLRVMKPEWFQGKEVLDVGCNVGHLTLSVAKKWGPARIVGVDIDGALIHSARQNIRHYLSEEMREQQCDRGGGSSEGASRAKKTFPASLMASRGPIAAPRVPQDGVDATVFPNNVFFVKGNYVLEQDELLEAQKPEYDVILCLSLTKWVHLNWGDEGLKRLFKRFYRHLHPGGILILEPQAWSSYGKRKNLTETICRHYYRIKLKPDQFPSYLTSPEVGFCSYELVATPRNTSKGFQRPIYLFHKAGPGAH